MIDLQKIFLTTFCLYQLFQFLWSYFCMFAAVIEFPSCSLSLFDKHKTIINII